MKWRAKRNSAEEEDQRSQAIPIIINTSEGGEQQFSQLPIRVLDNKIFFYADVEEASALELNKILYEMDSKLQNTKTLFGSDFTPTIHLHINTFGGSVFAAFSTVDTIRCLKSKVYTYIDGSVASAGTLMSIIGQRRFMGAHAHLLIHQLSSGVYGKFSEIEDEIFNCNTLMRLMKDFYKKHTKMPMKKLDELMKHDIWMTAEECLASGIIDEII